MRTISPLWTMAILVAVAGITLAADPTPQELLDAVGIPPTGRHRGQLDTVGYVTTAAQMDSVLAQCPPAVPAGSTPLSAVVCPHDDYAYAARLYSLVIPRIEARTVVVFGVFHKARVFACRDHLVFDGFETWRGPYGPVKVSPLREEILARLPEDDYLVNDDMHVVEHSIEAIVPWLQALHRDVEIVPILVPSMDWENIDRLAGDCANALAAILDAHGWTLGEDVALIASCDAVHYGDAGWGSTAYADFGTDIDGYRQAVDRDIDLARSTLTGAVKRTSLRKFLYTCVDENDVTRYEIPWCGRFSVPFGLNVASRLSKTLDGRPLEGSLLGYGTSVSEASLDLDRIEGLGTTAPNNLHHWVGYAALGYR